MAAPLEQFVKQIADSGVISPGKLENFVPPKAQPKDAEELVRQLVQSRYLTKFQAQEILLGRAKSLILGNYTVLDKIGAGGMGQVFKAQHRRMERVVAIKMLPPAITTDTAAVARFQREAKAAARLEHPNIVTAFDADEANGLHFLVMQFVEGSDLSALVKKDGPFPIDKALEYILQAARGLDYAHKHGVVHRDIKPSNLLLNSECAVKIFDMGLARINAVDDAETQAELTGTGAIMGTVDYMAPEQAISTHHADARSDIYSLGCTLHYLVTGHPAYNGITLMAKLVAHRENPIPTLGLDMPEHVQSVFEKMVAKKTDDRYQTMSEVIAALEKCQDSLAPVVATSKAVHKDQTTKQESHPAVGFPNDKSPPPGKRRTLLVAAGAAGFLLLLLGVIVIIRNQKGEEVGRLELPPGQTAEIRETGPINGKADPNPKPSMNVNDPAFQQWMKEVAALPAEKQVQAVAKKLQELNPGFDGKVTGFEWLSAPRIENGVVTEFGFMTDTVIDISPVRALAGLRYLRCAGSEPTPGSKFSDLSPLKGMSLNGLCCAWTQVADLSPLKGMHIEKLDCDSDPLKDLTQLQGMPLAELNVGWCRSISDLSPLKGMRLKSLHCNTTHVSDLSPLRGMPLSDLTCGESEVVDLAPLRGMPLTLLNCGADILISDLSPLKEMPLKTLVCSNTAVSSLSPLRGMPLMDLDFSRSQIVDLSPLVGMPLTRVVCDHTPVSDLSPLQGLHLTSFTFTPTNAFTGLDVIRQMKSLGQIGPSSDAMSPADEFWKKFGTGEFKLWMNRPGFKKWLADTASLMPEKQVDAVTAKLRELNPGFDGTEKHEIGNGVVTDYGISAEHVADISPVRAFAGLTSLGCAINSYTGILADLSPLDGMRLNRLDCGGTEVSDLAPLKGMPLTFLNCGHTAVADLSPLKGMNLTTLFCDHTKVSDLSPLEGTPLFTLYCDHTLISDLSPLHGMNTMELIFTPKNITKGIDVVHQMKSIERINNRSNSGFLAPGEFWKKYDAGEFK